MKTKLILECGCNHNGSMEIAKQMIDKAVELGVWAVKFQKRDVELIPDDMKVLQRDLKNSFGVTYYDHRKALELSIDQIRELKDYADIKGLQFVCSAFDLYSVYALAGIGLKNIKIPSQFANNEDIISACWFNRNFRNIFISTGMRSKAEIFKMITINIPNYKTNIIHMHCISAYPAKINQANLITLYELCTKFKICGYSSHEIKGAVIKYAVIAGAEYIERHFTLDYKMKGSDHKTVSSEPAEIKQIIEDIEEAESILGDPARPLSKEEQKIREMHMRR